MGRTYRQLSKRQKKQLRRNRKYRGEKRTTHDDEPNQNKGRQTNMERNVSIGGNFIFS